MQREIIRTADGSTSIYLPELNENYHSRHGAVQEARHVFIQSGLDLFDGKAVSILEIGFGTGLNAFMTFLESEKKAQPISYTGVEAFPVVAEETALMNYAETLEVPQFSIIFTTMHAAAWEKPVALSSHFTLTKRQQHFESIDDKGEFDLIYFDAFGYPTQPELWSEDIFHKMFAALKPEGVLVTYAARSVIKRNMQTAGFRVEKLAGPIGKREMFRAWKGR